MLQSLTPDEQIIAAAIRRIYRWMAAFAGAGTLVVLAWKGWWYGGGFAVGAALSILNFHWLKTGVQALTGAFESGPDAPAAQEAGDNASDGDGNRSFSEAANPAASFSRGSVGSANPAGSFSRGSVGDGADEVAHAAGGALVSDPANPAGSLHPKTQTARFGGPGSLATRASDRRATRRKRTAVVVRFLLRYALIVGTGYVIFRSSVLSMTAFLGGLFVFVAGILAEMIYELATGTGTTD